MTDPLSIVGLVCAIGLIAAWAVMIIRTLTKYDDASNELGDCEDRDEREE